MKITIFGATGRTGMQVVEQALAAGHEVTAFVRDSAKMTLNNPMLHLVQGDVASAENVKQAVTGTEAVIVTLGGKPDSSPTMLTDGTTNIVNAMKEKGVNRLIVESSFAMNGSSESVAFLSATMPPEKVASLKPLLEDKASQQKIVESSGLNWTLVRPSYLNDEAKTGTYRIAESLDITAENHISRADVADFLLKQLTDSAWTNKIVTISY